VHFYPEGEATEAASAAVAIDASNKGFQLLQKMGWKGKGLGRKEDGAQHTRSCFSLVISLHAALHQSLWHVDKHNAAGHNLQQSEG
jgi:hypothetical protein